MALAKLANCLLLFRVQLFRPRKEKKGRLPGGQRNWRELGSFGCVLLAFWKLANKVITHTCIGPLVALRHEFLMEANHIVATRLPPLKKIGEIGVEAAHIGAARGLRIRASSKPVADGAVTNAH